MGILCLFVACSYAVPPRPSAVVPRDAALRYCNVESKRHPPGKYYDYDLQQNFWYKSCMFDLGQLP